MSFRQKSAWAVIGALAVAYLGYAATVIGRVARAGADGVDAVAYVDAAVASAIAVVALLATAHIALAAVARPDRAGRVAAPRRSAGSGARGALILSAGAVIALGLTMTGAAAFWTANVLITALVAGEIATAAARITDERAALRRA